MKLKNGYEEFANNKGILCKYIEVLYINILFKKKTKFKNSKYMKIRYFYYVIIEFRRHNFSFGI